MNSCSHAPPPTSLNVFLSPVHTERVKYNLHTSNERCQFKLYISYWTSNNNKGQNVRVAIELHHQTTPVLNDVIDNDVIDSWMNMQSFNFSSIPVGQMWSRRRDALGVNGALNVSGSLRSDRSVNKMNWIRLWSLVVAFQLSSTLHRYYIMSQQEGWLSPTERASAG